MLARLPPLGCDLLFVSTCGQLRPLGIDLFAFYDASLLGLMLFPFLPFLPPSLHPPATSTAAVVEEEHWSSVSNVWST